MYRDDAVTSGAEIGISGAQLDGEGRAIWNTRHTLATSRDISGDTNNISGGTHVIKNPSMAHVSGAYRAHQDRLALVSRRLPPPSPAV